MVSKGEKLVGAGCEERNPRKCAAGPQRGAVEAGGDVPPLELLRATLAC